MCGKSIIKIIQISQCHLYPLPRCATHITFFIKRLFDKGHWPIYESIYFHPSYIYTNEYVIFVQKK